MNAPAAAQRHYRAPCPNCGAPVVFQSAQSTHVICAYCRSTVVREGEALRRIGQMAELFEDHSPLQLGTSGRIDGQGFVLVGRLQYQYAEGVWTEWHALLEDGSSAWLSEDNGAYVFSRALPLPGTLPPVRRFTLGASVRVGGRSYAVASRVRATLRAAEGELPRLPARSRAFNVMELRSQGGDAVAQRVLSIDYSSHPPTLFEGRAVDLEALALQGLKTESAAAFQSGAFACPHCGAPVTPRLTQSRSITCPQCAALIDLSQGLGGKLTHALQEKARARPLIAVGARGQFMGIAWQVLGFQWRKGRLPGDDEDFTWSEYLLYNARQGFAFLSVGEDGWSLARPATGAPELTGNGRTARYDGVNYRLQEAYDAETLYAEGEFYWRVECGQRTRNSDFTNAGRLLAREQSAHEIIWSVGTRLNAQDVAKAFDLPLDRMPSGADAGPFTPAPQIGAGTLIALFLLLLLFAALLSTCSEDEDYSRSSGAAYGGYRLGGGHK
ncbi:DUF4178 domain-containing protein [Comamonadaceae bacterium OH2545_COT-014]|nr:DUF4178 domain-containing protein [Comamonadaceae bacterium OH2545_COT-014]